MLRVLGVLVLLGVAAVFVAPSWDRGARTLQLHLRSGAELENAIRAAARRFGAEIASKAVEPSEPGQRRDRAATPAVGADGRRPSEDLTTRDRARLDELVEKALREAP